MDAAGEPGGWLDQTPWEERRRPFQPPCSATSWLWGHPDQDRDVVIQTGKNDHLAQELTEAAGEDGRLVPALAQRLSDWRRTATTSSWSP